MSMALVSSLIDEVSSKVVYWISWPLALTRILAHVALVSAVDVLELATNTMKFYPLAFMSIWWLIKSAYPVKV
jgi:hypothetical protein